MDFTGERFLPKLSGDIRLEHFHRYLLCSQIIKGKIVLDIASGEGYGSNILAKSAEYVIGVDISHEAIQSAKSNYQTSNLKYMVGDACKIPLEDSSIDVVVSFETIEHHDKHIEMMREIKRVLRPDGILILSSPNKQIYSDNAGGDHNHFHVKELYFNELHSLIGNYFQFTTYYGQKTIIASLIAENNIGDECSDFNIIFDKNEDLNLIKKNNFDPMYFIVVASNNTHTNLLRPSIYTSVYDDYFHQIQKEVIKLNSEIKRMSSYIEEVEMVLKTRDNDLQHYKKKDVLTKIKGILKYLLNKK